MNWYKLSQVPAVQQERFTIGPFMNLELLGCGENGCAYLDPATHHAIKDTTSSAEAKRAFDLLDSDYPFFPRIYQVIKDKNSWIIEREEIPSLSADQMDLMDTVQMALEEVDYDLNQLPVQLPETLYEFGMDPEEDYDKAAAMAEQLMGLLEAVQNMGGKPNDIRGDNIGIRDGQLVVRDIDV